MRLKITLYALCGALILASGCGGQSPIPLAELLPLAKDQPTFVFFYTDG